jgi:hypothetical protein
MSIQLSEWDFSTITVEEACALTLQWQRDDADNTNNNLPIAVRLQRRQSARPGALYCPRMDRLEPETMVKVIEVASPHAVHRVRVRQLRVVRGARPARWRNGVCGCLLVAMLAILFSSLSASRLTAAPLPAGHSLADAVRQHRLLGDSGAPFSVFWAAQLSRDDELNRLLSSDVASTVVRVRQCDSADLATVHAWQLRLMSAAAAAAPSSESLLVLVDDACAPKCQDALTMWLDDSLPLVRGSARHLYYVLLTGAHGECTREALAARLAHRIMNFV